MGTVFQRFRAFHRSHHGDRRAERPCCARFARGEHVPFTVAISLCGHQPDPVRHGRPGPALPANPTGRRSPATAVAFSVGTDCARWCSAIAGGSMQDRNERSWLAPPGSAGGSGLQPANPHAYLDTVVLLAASAANRP